MSQVFARMTEGWRGLGVGEASEGFEDDVSLVVPLAGF